MRDVLEQLESWWTAGRPVAMATVVGSVRSGPRPPGASMLVGPDGEVVGGVSGGCVEGAVYELGTAVRDGHEPSSVQRYGVSDDDAFAVGLTCGGVVDVFVERIAPDTFPRLGSVAAAVRDRRPVAVATVIAGPREQTGTRVVVWADGVEGGIDDASVNDTVVRETRSLLAAGRSARLSVGGEHVVFVESLVPAPRLVVYGAVEVAAALVRTGTLTGMRVDVCDARPVFATRDRFPDAHEVVVDWPHRHLAAEAAAARVDRRTSLVVLTHDPKFDVPLLDAALRLPEIGYVGAMGSRDADERRRACLRDRGLGDAQLARLASPIGLDLGASTPEETAVSIIAEIIAWRRGGDGRPLSRRDGPIHRSGRDGDGVTVD